MAQYFIVFSIVFLTLVFSQEDLPIQHPGTSFISKDTSLWVTATAYNAIEEQTKQGSVGIGAWGDRLTADMKAIAVSNDLIEMGLTRNREVRIEGLNGIYKVMDKMNDRWTRKIDIFMGYDHEAAILWGNRKVKITFKISD
jgi:3D (Asp-Asp-Asp) domain-containing protein